MKITSRRGASLSFSSSISRREGYPASRGDNVSLPHSSPPLSPEYTFGNLGEEAEAQNLGGDSSLFRPAQYFFAGENGSLCAALGGIFLGSGRENVCQGRKKREGIKEPDMHGKTL